MGIGFFLLLMIVYYIINAIGMIRIFHDLFMNNLSN